MSNRGATYQRNLSYAFNSAMEASLTKDRKALARAYRWAKRNGLTSIDRKLVEIVAIIHGYPYRKRPNGQWR